MKLTANHYTVKSKFLFTVFLSASQILVSCQSKDPLMGLIEGHIVKVEGSNSNTMNNLNSHDMAPNSSNVLLKSSDVISCKTVISANKDEYLTSLAYSVQNNLLFVGSTKGKILVLNDRDSVVKTFSLVQHSSIDIDNVGEVGAIILNNGSRDDNKTTVLLFKQKQLEIFDTLTIPSNETQGSFKVWFTKSDIYLSSFTNVYKYDKAKGVTVAINSYSILDYDYKTDQLVLGYWDNKLLGDRKVKKLFICDATNLLIRRPLLTIERSFELYTFFVEKASSILSYDGRSNYYRFDLSANKRTITIQDTIKDDKRKYYGLAKIDETTLLVVRHNPISINAENIQRYDLKVGDTPIEFVFKDSMTGEIKRSCILKKGVSANKIVMNNKSMIYYLTSGGMGNKLLSFK